MEFIDYTTTSCNQLDLEIYTDKSGSSMIGENRQLVTDEPIEFEK